MPRVSINMSDKEHMQYKVACVENGETMTEAGRKMLALYASGLLYRLDDAWQPCGSVAFDDAAAALADWLNAARQQRGEEG